MLKLTVIVKAKDAHQGKPVADLLFQLYHSKGITGATVFQGVRGYGIRGVARADILGMSINLPVEIETVAEREKILEVIPQVRSIVEGNGLVTTTEVDVY